MKSHDTASAVVLAVANVGISREQKNTQAALGRAETILGFAHEAVDELLLEIGLKGLEDESLPGPATRALLEKALAFYEQFLLERKDIGHASPCRQR